MAGSPRLREPRGDPQWGTYVLYVCRHLRRSLCHRSSGDGAGSAGSSAPVHSAGKQLSQPLRKPRSPHCVLKTPARAKGVSLLFTSFVIMLFPKKRLRHLICRWNNFPMMPLCDYCHFFPHNNVKYNIKLWIFYSEWNQQSQKTDSAGSAVTAPFCKTAPG